MSPNVNFAQLIRAAIGFLAIILMLSGCLWQRELPRGTRALVGIVYVTGNEPFTHLALQADDGGVFKIRKDSTALYKTLWKLQGQRVRVQFRPVDAKTDTLSIVVERYDLVKVP